MTKKILLVGNRFAGKGGAEYSLIELKEFLESKKEIEVGLLTFERENYESKFDNHQVIRHHYPGKREIPMPVEVKKSFNFVSYIFSGGLEEKIESYNPDIILAQNGAALPVIRATENKDIKTGLWLHDYRFIQEGYHEGRLYTKPINWMAAKLVKQYKEKPILDSDFLFFNSKYTKSKYLKQFETIKSKEMEVLYPILQKKPFEIKQKMRGDKILHVNPDKRKGIETTIKIAKQMPEEEFIITGSKGPQNIMEQIENTENIEYRGYVEDIKDTYRQTKIVLMPSKWEEPFGRVPVEAGMNRIPTIAPARGGLEESVPGEHQVEDNPEAYRDKISEIENNNNKNSQISKNHAEDLIRHAKDSAEKTFSTY